jgi:hypothetical protein
MKIYNVFRTVSPDHGQAVDCRSYDSLEKAQARLKEIADSQKGWTPTHLHCRIVLEKLRLDINGETVWLIQETDVE